MVIAAVADEGVVIAEVADDGVVVVGQRYLTQGYLAFVLTILQSTGKNLASSHFLVS